MSKFNDIINKTLSILEKKQTIKEGIANVVNKAIQLGFTVRYFDRDNPNNPQSFSHYALYRNNTLIKTFSSLEFVDKYLNKISFHPPMKESMTAGGTGGVFTAYSGTVNAGATGGSVGNQDSYNPGDSRLFMGGGKAPSLKSKKKTTKKHTLKPIMPVQKRNFTKM